MIKTIAKILQSKGDSVWCITPDGTVYEALEIMEEKNVGALVVMEGTMVVGIISERDYARKVALKGLNSMQTAVKDIMASDVFYITPEKSVEEGLAIVTETHCRHLPVLKGDDLVGVISIGDLVKASLAEKDFLIRQLKGYIKGG